MGWDKQAAQRVVNNVAVTAAGWPAPQVEAELTRWLERDGVVLPEPFFSEAVEAIAGGSRVVELPGG